MEHHPGKKLLAVVLFFFVSRSTPVASQTQSSSGVDVVAFIDTQATAGSQAGAVVQQFLQHFTKELDLSEDGSRMSVVSVGESTDTVLSLTDGINADAVADAFAKMQAGEGSTADVTLGLSSATAEAEDFLAKKKNRPDVPTFVIVIYKVDVRIFVRCVGVIITINGVTIYIKVTTIEIEITITRIEIDLGKLLEQMENEFERLLDQVIERFGSDVVYRSLCYQEVPDKPEYRWGKHLGEVVCHQHWKRHCACYVVGNFRRQYRLRGRIDCTCTYDRCTEALSYGKRGVDRKFCLKKDD